MTREGQIRERLSKAIETHEFSYWITSDDVDFLLKRIERFEYASRQALPELHPMRMPYTYVMQALNYGGED